MKEESLFVPGWLSQIIDLAAMFGPKAFHGLMVHHAVTGPLGEALENKLVTPEMVNDLVAGLLVHRDKMVTQSVSAISPATIITPTISTSHLVEALLRDGVWKFARRTISDKKVGMGETEYGDLWPREVTMPVGYADRYPHLLLRDDTVSLAGLRAMLRGIPADFYAEPDKCRVLPGVPEFLLGLDGQRLNRAVFFWGYKQYLDRSATDCRRDITTANIPLIHHDGLWIMNQDRDGVLRHHTIDLIGSICERSFVPCVHRFKDSRPHFNAFRAKDPPRPYGGSGFRGSEIVAVP